MIIQKKCVCGKTFKTHDYRIRDGRGKFCSKKCQYENATRPSGLDYNIKVVNPTWFKRGDKKTKSWYEAMKNYVPYNKGTKGLMKPNKTSFTKEDVIGDKNIKWKGDDVGYFSSHAWMIRTYGKADMCENRENNILDFKCSGKSNNYDWAFMGNGQFKRDRKLYLMLCHSCHLKYDWSEKKKICA
jgi:hypothetical protein